MAKFDLNQAKQATKQETVLGAGYYRVMITQVAEVGLQKAFDRAAEPKESIGLCFETTDGMQVVKIMSLSMNIYSNFSSLLSACDEVEVLEELQSKQLDLEIESNGKYPKITGYYHVDDGISGQSVISEHDTVFYSADDPDSETLKKLHRDLRQAISARVRNKG